MKDVENLKEIAALNPDYLGFIFYDKSPRFVGDNFALASWKDEKIKKVGVFVNELYAETIRVRNLFSLDVLQLHGDESPEICMKFKEREDVKIFKAISIDSEEDLKRAEIYDGKVDALLFDTKTKHYGGSGETFDWSILDAYKGETPFLLSGGLSLDNIKKLDLNRWDKLAGFDVNSRFELESGLMDVELLKKLLVELEK